MTEEWNPPKDENGESRSFAEGELLPCPFCGGEAIYERMGDGRKSCIVACENCSCRLESNEQEWTNGWSWNRRVSLSASPAEQAQEQKGGQQA